VQLHECKLSDSTSISFTREGNLTSNLIFIGLHGGPGSHNDFKYISFNINNMLKIPHQFIRFDLPGYGKSTRFSSPPTSSNYASSVLDTLSTLNLTDNKQIVLIGHSLGGHVAVDLCSRVRTTGLILISSVCCRPHKALLNERGFGVVRWLGRSVSHPFYGEFVKSFLNVLYKRFLGFPKSAKKEEIAWTQERVAYLDWASFVHQVKNLSCPVLFAYALDDHLIQSARFEEMAALLTGKHKKILVFGDGGHNIQKTKAEEISSEVCNWVELINNGAKVM